jgi:hypothetical protein
MRRISRKAALLCLFLAPLAQGAAPAPSPDKDEPLDTVLVEGTRAELNKTLQEMVLSEDRFFKRYNELNTKDDFDMMCFREARVGTRFQRRYCLAVYMDKALEKEGRDQAYYLKDLYVGADVGGISYSLKNDPPMLRGPPPVPSIIMIEARRKEFKQNMRDVVAKHPELVDMLRERYELGKRHEAMRRKVFGLKPLPEESQAAPVEASPP